MHMSHGKRRVVHLIQQNVLEMNNWKLPLVISTHPISKVPTRTQGSCSICLRPISKVPTRTQGGSSIGLRRISKVPTRMQGGSSIGLRRIYKVLRAAHVCIFHVVHEYDIRANTRIIRFFCWKTHMQKTTILHHFFYVWCNVSCFV